MTTSVRHIEYLPVASLPHALKNPKRHSSVELGKSIERFGFTAPIEIDERTGRIVSGHGRADHLVMLEGGNQPPPEGVTVDEEGRWLVPVVRGWASKDDEDAAAYIVGANRIVEQGGWDEAALADVLVELAADPTDGLAGTGYDETELEALLASLSTESRVSDDPFSGFPAPNMPDVVSFSFGDYSGKVSRKTYEAFVVAFEQQRAAGDDVLLDDVLARWLSLA